MNAKINTAENYWGLAAIYEGQKLVFSGTFSQERIWRERWKKFFSVFKKDEDKAVQTTNGQTDLYNLFSPNARQVWNQAFLQAQHRRANVTLEDIFLALLNQQSVLDIFRRLGADTNAAKVLLKNYLQLKTPGQPRDELQKIPFEAYVLATKFHDPKIGSLMLLGALVKIAPQDGILQAIFSNLTLTLYKLEVLAVWELDLNYSFPESSAGADFLDCCRQAEGLEKHFGYFYQFSAIETAVIAAAGQFNKDQRHKTTLGLLVKGGLLGRQNQTKIISEQLIQKASA